MATSTSRTEATVEVDPQNKMEERDAEIAKLIKIVSIITQQLGGVGTQQVDLMNKGIVDIDFSDEVAGLLMTVYMCLRKEQNDKKGHEKYKTYTAKVGGVEVGVLAILEKVKSEKIEIDFLIATPIVELMTLFKASFDEVRTGVTKFLVRENVAKSVKRNKEGRLVVRDDPKKMYQNISQYGLTNNHVPFLRGITFAPERRTRVIGSLGPLSQCMMLVREDRDYTQLSNALKQSLNMLPMSKEVIGCLKEATNPWRVAGVMKELGDILVLTTARSTQKFYFPLMVYVYMWNMKPNDLSWSFSGAAMIKYYTSLILAGKLQFKIKTNGDEGHINQVLFHAIFGTYLEDLDVCEQITLNSGRWLQRKELNSVFAKRGTAPAKTFAPIAFRYVLLTESLGNIDSVSISRPSFYGMRKRNLTQEYITYLRTGKSATNYSTDPIKLQYSLKNVKDQILEDLYYVKLLRAGTTKWETIENNVWVPVDFEVIEGARQFFGV